MVMAGGSLQVESGTSLRIESALSWELALGASVINDGLIDFGTSATIVELPFAPITGSGIEAATWSNPGPLTDAEPGNLGLAITSAFSDGGLSVERGHLPRTSSNGIEGIARWYRVSTPVPSTAPMDAVLAYDLAEIGGVLPSALAIFTAGASTGPWSPVTTVGDAPQQILSAQVPAPEIFLTAFDFNAVLTAGSIAPSGWNCWPTVFDEGVTLAHGEGRALRSLRLVDGQGRVVHADAFAGANGTLKVPLAGLAAGAYALVVNDGEQVFKLVKP